MEQWKKVLLLAIVTLVLTSAQSRNETIQPKQSSPSLPLWKHSEYGAALVIPLSTSASASPLDGLYQMRLSTNVRTQLSDGLARHGYYTTTVYIGSPPQAFALIVDTGSTITYVPCSSCSHCGSHQDPSFKPEASSSYAAVRCDDLDCQMGSCAHSNLCNYARHYAEQSFSGGFLGRDIVRFGKGGLGLRRPLLFGCETTESGDLYWQHADGIMGLGRGSLSVVDQLNVQGAIASTFSLCYGGMDEDGGAMILGAIPPIAEMVFTPSNPTRSSYYNVVLKEIWVQGEPLPVKPSVFDGRYGTILDSGTTFAYLPEKAFNAFKDAVRTLAPASESITCELGERHVYQFEEGLGIAGQFVRGVKDLEELDGPDMDYKDICYSGAGTDPDKLSSYFPSIDFVFGGDKMVSLAAENYLFKHTKHPGAYCLGVFQNEDSTTILGGIVVRNMLVTYDRANERVGFLRTKCTKLWRTLFSEPSGESQASLNDSSIPPFGKADAENQWNNPAMPLSPPHYPGASYPGQTYPKIRLKNHSESDDVVPKKDEETSDASSALSPLSLSSPFMARCLRPLHMPSIVVIFITTFWK